MAKVWTIYKIASNLVGVIEAKDEEQAIEIASKEFKVAPNRPLAKPTKVRQVVIADRNVRVNPVTYCCPQLYKDRMKQLKTGEVGQWLTPLA